VSDDLVQSVDQKICERWRFTISEVSCKFPQISRSVLYEIITVRLGYHKVLSNMGSENAHGCLFDFLERRHKDGDKFLNQIVQVTGGETWISFVNVETTEQSK
jgi:hypothetical protein